MGQPEMTYRYPTALTIAGSDSCGGAGIQADLKTFSAMGVYGASVLTAITAQNTTGVRGIQAVNQEVLKGQLDAVFEDLHIDAVKTGMLHNRDAVLTVVDAVRHYKPRWLVVDPVMVSTSGSTLLQDDAINEIISRLFPLASLVTPNLDEASYLTGITIHNDEDMEKAGMSLLELGCNAVLMKGGHLSGSYMLDLLCIKGINSPYRFLSERIDTVNTHGTGCTLSSAITASLASGSDLLQAVSEGKTYVSTALRNGADTYVGAGHGGLNHFFAPKVMMKIKRTDK